MSAQCWGPYCPLPQHHGRYVHVIYPLARAIGIDAQGRAVELSQDEVNALAAQHRELLARSMQEVS